MKTIKYTKLSWDILMLLIFALLYFLSSESHEIAGLALGGAFVIHLGLNGRRVKQVTANLSSRKISLKTKIGHLVVVLLLLSMGLTIVSGVMISKTILVGVFTASNNHLFKGLHKAVSFASLILVGIHVGLNWSWVMNTFKRKSSVG